MKKLLTLSAGVTSLAVAGLMLAPSFAQAASRDNGNGYGYQKSLTNKAQVLGMTTDQLKTQLQDKTLLQVAKDKGLTHEQFEAKMEQAAEARWKEMGLTQAQIDARKTAMEERQANCDGTGGGMNQYHGNR